MPLRTDIEDATSLDVLLYRGDTDLSVPFRVLLRYQTVAQRADLDARIGALSESGRDLIRDVLAGHAPEDRFGSPVEGQDDPRLVQLAEIEGFIRLLGRAYALKQEQDDTSQEWPRIAMLPMRREVREVGAGEAPTLAAASAAHEEVLFWDVDVPAKGRIRGHVEFRVFDDELVFVIEDLLAKEDLVAEERPWYGKPVEIVLWSERLAAPVTSEPFVPEEGRRVVLVRDRGVLPGEISRLELRISDES